MPQENTKNRPSPRRYSPTDKEQAVRLVRELRRELGTDKGVVRRIARQLGYGVESVRHWVTQADIDDGLKAGLSTDEISQIRELRQKISELRRANEILRRASVFFAAELDRPHK